MKRVVMMSGGLGSWAAAKRVALAHGTDNLTLLFCDTKSEDEDVYRFLEEAAQNVGGELVKIADGRTVWEVFFDERFLGNSRYDPCSKILKRELSDRWLRENRDPKDTTVYVGIGHQERHRFYGGRGKKGLRALRAKEGWVYEAPMCEAPYLATYEVKLWAAREGLTIPGCYDEGFAHANCAGGCVKAGQAQWRLLWKLYPDRYAYHEAKEQEIRKFLEKDVSILTDRRGGVRRPLTLKEFRERLEASKGKDCDLLDWGGCNCFANLEEDEENEDAA